MKVLQFILCLTIIGFTSCSSDDDSSTNPDPVTKPFFVEINGTDFEATSITAQMISDDVIAIEGIDAQGLDVILGFSGNLAEGTVFNSILNSDGTNVFTPIYDTDNGGFFATTAQLTIVSHDEDLKTMTGRFSFSGADPNDNSQTINFTNGEFMVIYSNE